MSYMDNKAAGRRIKFGAEAPAAALPKESVQAQTVGQAAKFSHPSEAPAPGVMLSNQLRMQSNYKGTETTGETSAVALRNKGKVWPAAQNPDGERNRPNPGVTAPKRPNAETKQKL